MNLKLLPTQFLLFLCFIQAVRITSADNNSNKDWWKKSNYYQIYSKSFQEGYQVPSTGVGNIDGIKGRLSYLKEIGINAVCLSPIFKTPMIHNGYDISDFKTIDVMFGNIYQFESLISTVQEYGIKIILDLVPNHSSDQHEWFKKSVSKEKGYEDFYVWHDGIPDKDNSSNMLPPNNWRSVYGGSAWTWNERRKQFYYHQFYKEQPDLNFRNPTVKTEMKDILTYWLDKGVDGIKVDGASHIFEDERFLDEPIIPNVDLKEYNSLDHIYTSDQDETFEIIYEWRQILDKYTKSSGGVERVLLAESYSKLNKKMKYYGDEDKKGAHFPFNFLLLNLNEKSTASDYVSNVTEWIKTMPEGETANWVIGNHDNLRAVNRISRDKANLLNMFMLSLPGVTVTYYGEELGMENVKLSEPKDARDIQRSPMQWNDGTSAGFTRSNKPWLPVSQDYKNRNVKIQRQIPLSNLNNFKFMTKLREKYNFFDPKAFSLSKESESLIKITRSEIILLFNVGITSQKISLILRSEVLFMNEHSKKRIGDLIPVGELTLLPNEVVILKSLPKNVIMNRPIPG